MPRFARRNLSLSLTCVLFLPTVATAQITHWVDSQSQSPVSPYLLKSQAAQTIQEALAVSSDGDTINVVGGDNREYSGPIDVDKNVIIQPAPVEEGGEGEGGGGPPIGPDPRSPCCSVHVRGNGSQPVFTLTNRQAPTRLPLRHERASRSESPRNGSFDLLGLPLLVSERH